MAQDSDINVKVVAIRDYLRSNFDDPIGGQRQWIHYDTLEGGLESPEAGKTPCVFIERVPSVFGWQGVGSAERIDGIVIDIHSIIRFNDTGSIDGNQYKRNELLDKITQTIDELLLTNATSITGIAWVNRISLGGVLKTDMFKISTWRYIIQ